MSYGQFLKNKSCGCKPKKGENSFSWKGYTKENIQWLDKHVNIAKRALEENEFIELCRLVAKNN